LVYWGFGWGLCIWVGLILFVAKGQLVVSAVLLVSFLLCEIASILGQICRTLLGKIGKLFSLPPVFWFRWFFVFLGVC
jgi:hypothetical protein